MTRIGRCRPCTTSRPFAFNSSRLPANAKSLFGASMSIAPLIVRLSAKAFADYDLLARVLPWRERSVGNPSRHLHARDAIPGEMAPNERIAHQFVGVRIHVT